MARRRQKQINFTFRNIYYQCLNKFQMYVLDPSHSYVVMILLFFAEICLNLAVILKRNYTEIDWIAYMQEVQGVVNGTYDYAELKGNTGPIVYPAGFVYIYTILYHITNHGANIRLAQYIFAALYLLNLLIVFDIYRHLNKIPGYVLVFMCCASYRIHSIYILRLFNDPVAMVFLYASVNLFIRDHWTVGCFIYSLGVSIKMNVLLYSPAILYLLLVRQGLTRTVLNLALCAVVQLFLAIPFLVVNPISYLALAFNLGRQFLFEWTVNWRFLPEWLFLHRVFHVALLTLHVAVLWLFAIFKWSRIVTFKDNTLRKPAIKLSPTQIMLPMFTCNLIGIAFCRSLHYQFYVWYFHTLHYLLWMTNLPVVCRLLLLGVVELSWNAYPSTVYSSAALHVCHAVLLAALWLAPFPLQRANKKIT